MKRTFLFCISVAIIQLSFAQMDMATGNLATSQVYSVHGRLSTGFVESFKTGSPFFEKDWMNSNLTLVDGKEIKGVKTKINLLTNEVYYLNKNNEYVSDSPIKEIILLDEADKEKYRFVNFAYMNLADKKQADGWYLEDISGPVSLYKKVEKIIEESKQYGSATTERSIKTDTKYVVLHNYALTELNKLKDVYNVLYDKKTELEKYGQAEKLQKPSGEAYRKLIGYYNSLVAK